MSGIRRNPHKYTPQEGETVLRADGSTLTISTVNRRSELGYFVSVRGYEAQAEIFRGGQDWLLVADMFDYRGVPLAETGTTPAPYTLAPYVAEDGDYGDG